MQAQPGQRAAGAAPLSFAGKERGGVRRGITIAEWFLELAFTAALCLAGPLFCLSVGAEHSETSFIKLQ